MKKNELWQYCKGVSDEVVNAYESGELWDYLSENALDVELRISPNKVLRSVEYAITLGGPSVYIDTARKGVVAYWGGEESWCGLPTDICDQLEYDAAEIYGYEN